MLPTDTSAESAAIETASAGEPPVAEEISLSELAAHTGEYARAWGNLFLSETALAKTNLLKLLLVALLVPAVALSVLLCLDALMAALLHGWLQNWIYASAIVFLLNALGLLAMFWRLLGWWRTLTLPRTRAALSRLMEGLQ
jgi:uncharacterized membrane protein YqjE